jgi:preprotein translocase subunit YajC
MSFIPFLQTAGASAASSQSLLMTVLPFVLIIVIFYFFIIRPQNKKQKETEKMISALKKGDKVVTIGGIHGVVSSTKEKTVIVKVDDEIKLEFNRSAIAVVEPENTGREENAKPAGDKKAEKAKADAEEKK